MDRQSIPLSARRARALAALCLLAAATDSWAAPTVPSGFRIEEVASGFSQPVALAIASGGRIFVTEKATGWVRVIREDSLLARPLVDLAVNSCGERGALGIALDPDFESTRQLYVFYTLSSTGGDSSERDSVVDHRVVRWTVDGDTAVAGSETLVRSLPVGLCAHNGGNIHFGPDRALYVTLGDENLGAGLPLDLSDLRGKLLRLDPQDGQAAPDNFYANDGDPGTLGEIWAYGLRNSFDFTFHPVTGALFATENGPDSDDEINHLVERGNYGWPVVEGPADTPPESAYAAGQATYRDPLWSSGAITTCPTGVVVVPSYLWAGTWGPSLLVGQCNPFGGSRQIVRLPLAGAAEDSAGGPMSDFATGFGGITDLELDTEQRLYVCTWSTLWRIVPEEPVGILAPQRERGLAIRVLGNPSPDGHLVRLTMPATAPARLTLRDVRGRLLGTWAWDRLSAGEHEVGWDGRGRDGYRVPPGVYFWHFRGAGAEASATAIRTR